MEGADLLTKAKRGTREASAIIARSCEQFVETGDPAYLLSDELVKAMAASQERPDLTRSRPFPLVVDRSTARCAAWYEMVPRSQGKVPGQHGTFKDCIERIPDVAAMGFDVLYFTPIHPIGLKNRK
jgi:starch synthase (maltosyl-transferring)